MKILFLAPHPFFQERGTPIDDMLMLRVLSKRKNTQIDMLVYHEGTNVEFPHFNLHRIPNFKRVRNIRPGFSFKKLFCDVFLFFKAWQLVRKNKYNLIHAVEESVFMAMFFKFFYKIPYAFDLDSSISQQLVESKPGLKRFAFIFDGMEGVAIRNSIINLPVCNALADFCTSHQSKKSVTIHDISQLKDPNAPATGDLKKELNIKGLIILYVGNLEPYQGIDLLIDSFKKLMEKTQDAELVIIGGVEEDIQFYKEKAQSLGVLEKSHFLGPKKFANLHVYLAESDILAVPRIKGVNTPMKIFPFLHSGRPVIATDLPTHTQILTSKEAFLAQPDPQGFSEGLYALVTDQKLRTSLGKSGFDFVEKNHTFSAHERRVNLAYDWVEEKICTCK